MGADTCAPGRLPVVLALRSDLLLAGLRKGQPEPKPGGGGSPAQPSSFCPGQGLDTSAAEQLRAPRAAGRRRSRAAESSALGEQPRPKGHLHSRGAARHAFSASAPRDNSWTCKASPRGSPQTPGHAALSAGPHEEGDPGAPACTRTPV